MLVFALAGAFDFVWHELFGFEVNLEALLSPAHLSLAVGAVLFMVGPLRALWGRANTRGGWADLFPAVASATFVLSLVTMFTQFANVMSQPDIFVGRRPGNDLYFWDATLATSVLLLVRRWVLPFGAITFVLLVNALLMFYLRIGYIGEQWPALIAALIAGIVGDLLLVGLRPSADRVGALRLFAFAVPFSYFLAFFISLLLTGGIAGLGMSYLLAPPAIPGDGA